MDRSFPPAGLWKHGAAGNLLSGLITKRSIQDRVKKRYMHEDRQQDSGDKQAEA